MVGGGVSVWLVVEYLCGWWYSICVVGDSVSVWLMVVYMYGWW